MNLRNRIEAAERRTVPTKRPYRIERVIVEAVDGKPTRMTRGYTREELSGLPDEKLEWVTA